MRRNQILSTLRYSLCSFTWIVDPACTTIFFYIEEAKAEQMIPGLT